MTHTYAISAPEVKHDLIWATGHDSEGLIEFTARDGSCYGVFWPTGLINVAGAHGSWPAELVWQGEVPKPFSLNYVSAVSWIKTQVADEKARVAEAQPDPTQDFYTRIEGKIDELKDMYQRTAAATFENGDKKIPRQVGKIAELAKGYGSVTEAPRGHNLPPLRSKRLQALLGLSSERLVDLAVKNGAQLHRRRPKDCIVASCPWQILGNPDNPRLCWGEFPTARDAALVFCMEYEIDA